jgi:type VI secretion system protein ImpA
LAECLSMHPDSDISPYSDPSQADIASTGPSTVPTAGVNIEQAVPGVPRSREDAYRQLASIAEYLARYEPHSPVPYLIQRALEWGCKPLPILLRELMSSDADGQRLWTFLGLLRSEADEK